MSADDATGGKGRFCAPEPLGPHHEVIQFRSGEPELDDWLKRRALKNQGSGTARTYAVCEGKRVIGYYCLSTGAVSQEIAPGRVRRNMPEPIPVMVVGRLAVDRDWQGRGIGRALVRDALLRTLQASEIAGIRAVLIHALHEQARLFYEHCGFYSSPTDPMSLMITMDEARKTIEG